MSNDKTPVSGWEPEFTLDLAKATAQQFNDLVQKFEASTLALGTDLPPVPFPENGWYTNTPQTAEASLRRNRPGSNRKLSFATVVYYWRQMKDGQWQKTGQPIIFDVEGWMIDSQHRNWAGYLGQVPFDTYVIVDAPIIANVFAYLDNIKARTPAAALQTAQFNGLSAVIGQTIQIATNYDIGAYTCLKTKHVLRMSPIEFLHYAKANPVIKDAVRNVVANHKQAVTTIGYKDITAFVAYKIASLHDEDTADRFLEELAFPNETLSDNDALRFLRTYLAKQLKTDDPEPKHLVLAHVIKAFNAWVNGIPVKNIKIATDDPFPQFAEPDKSEDQEAA